MYRHLTVTYGHESKPVSILERLHHGVCHTAFFLPEFSSVFSAHLRAALSKAKAVFFIQTMKLTHRQKILLHQANLRYPSRWWSFSAWKRTPHSSIWRSTWARMHSITELHPSPSTVPWVSNPECLVHPLQRVIVPFFLCGFSSLRKKSEALK